MCVRAIIHVHSPRIFPNEAISLSCLFYTFTTHTRFHPRYSLKCTTGGGSGDQNSRIFGVLRDSALAAGDTTLDFRTVEAQVLKRGFTAEAFFQCLEEYTELGVLQVDQVTCADACSSSTCAEHVRITSSPFWLGGPFHR